jgi:ice-binding like protein
MNRPRRRPDPRWSGLDRAGTPPRPYRRPRRAAGSLLVALLGVAWLASSAQAAPVPLGAAGSFAVLASSTVSNTGPSVVTGDLGLTPGTSVTGFPPGTVVGGAVHATDAVALQAQNDLVTAYNDAAALASNATISSDLAGRTLTPGVYTSASSIGLSGALTLDARGDPNAVFVFQAGSTLTAASASRVVLIGGTQACNVFWKVGSSATIGTGSAFVGNILAQTSITLTTGATLDGRALARTGAVTRDTNTVTRSTCATQATTPPPAGTPGAGGGRGGTSPAASRATAATARLSGPTACVDSAFVARVRGHRIAQVMFFVDGRFRRTVRAIPGRTVFSLRVNPRGQRRAVHRVTARVRFTAASRAKTRTLRFAYTRCAAAMTRPRFTG